MRRRGFTLIELLVVIAIIAILAAILFPVFAKARGKAKQAACMSNIKQITMAFMMYVQDNDDTYMRHCWQTGDPNTTMCWMYDLQPYTKNWAMFICPSRDYHWAGDCNRGYGFNMIALDEKKAGAIKRPTDLILVADSRRHRQAEQDDCPASFLNHMPLGGGCGWSGCDSGDSCLADWHNDGANLGFCDGHVKWMKKTAVEGGYPALYNDGT